jgi:hypothetical protein
VATFAAYRVPAVKAALGRAVERGVTVRLILETTAVRAGARWDSIPFPRFLRPCQVRSRSIPGHKIGAPPTTSDVEALST